MDRDDGGTEYHTKATVLVPGTLSYCVVRSEGHYEALSSMYPTPTELLENATRTHVRGGDPVDGTNDNVTLWVLEGEAHTQAICDYHPFHLDFGPWTWMQASRMLATITDVRSHIGSLRSARRRSEGVRRTQSVRRPLDDDEDTPSDGSGVDTSGVCPQPPPQHSGATNDDDHELDCPMVLVVVRLFLGLPHATNLIACLGVMAVLAGVVTDPGSLHTYFPYDAVMRWTVPFHDATPYDDVEAFFDLTATDAILAALHAFQLWPTEMLDAHRFVVAHDYFQRLEHGDISWIAPWKYVAFASPGDDAAYRTPEGGGPHPDEMRSASGGDVLPRAKSAAYYATVFSEPRGFYGTVGTVIQLNDNVRYDGPASFGACGIQHETLFFVDGSFPTPQVVAKFFGIVDGAQARRRDDRANGGRPCDAIALHCMAGLGRTGTLICLALMRDFGFTAKGAIAWSRLCRPGSVIGPQQAFLCYTEGQWKRSLFDDTMFTKTPSAALDVGGRGGAAASNAPPEAGGGGGHTQRQQATPTTSHKTTDATHETSASKRHGRMHKAAAATSPAADDDADFATLRRLRRAEDDPATHRHRRHHQLSDSSRPTASTAPPVAMEVDRTSLVEIVINRNLSSTATTSASASSVVFRPRTHGGVHAPLPSTVKDAVRGGGRPIQDPVTAVETLEGGTSPVLLGRYADQQHRGSAHRRKEEPIRTATSAQRSTRRSSPKQVKSEAPHTQFSRRHDGTEDPTSTSKASPPRTTSAGRRRRGDVAVPLFTTYTVGASALPPSPAPTRRNHCDARHIGEGPSTSRLPASVQSWLDEDAQRLKGESATPPRAIRAPYYTDAARQQPPGHRTEDVDSRTATMTSSTTRSNHVHHVSITL